MFLVGYILWAVFLLVGLVYLVTEAELTESVRSWFTSAVLPNTQDTPNLESTNAFAELTGVQTNSAKTNLESSNNPTDLPVVQTTNELDAQIIKTDILTKIAVDTCKAIHSISKETAVMPILPQPEGTETLAPPVDVTFPPPLTPPRRRLRRFVGRVVACAFCTAGWASIPAAGLVTGAALAVHYHVWWLLGSIAVLTTPPTGIGVMWTLDRLSPLRASDRVVDAAIDVATAVMERRGK